MTTTSQAAGLDAIGRMYDETMASIADMADPYVEPWPATEEIDVASIKPPTPTRRSSPELASSHRRPWRRWFSFLAVRAAPAR